MSFPVDLHLDAKYNCKDMPDLPTTEPSVAQDHSSLFLGLLMCWLLNMVQLGVAWLLFVRSERMLPSVFVLIGALGLLQIGYVVPLWYIFRRRGMKRMAKGLLIAAAFTLLVNVVFWMVMYVNG